MKRTRKGKSVGSEHRMRVATGPDSLGGCCGWTFGYHRTAAPRPGSRGLMWAALLGLAGVLLLLSGCAIGPNYKRPVVDAPDSFRFTPDHSTNSLGDLPWWEVFKDPTLLGLIQTAVT